MRGTIGAGRNTIIRDLERHLRDLDGVDPRAAVVVRVPDGRGDTESAAIVFAPSHGEPAEADDVRTRVARSVATRFGVVPAHVVALPWSEFPRSRSGHIQRGVLRGRFREHVAAAVDHRHAVPRDAPTPVHADDLDVSPVIEGARAPSDVILQFFRRTLDATATLDSDFFALGGNSVLAAELLATVAAALDVRLPTDAVFKWPTPRQLAAAAAGRRVRVAAGAVALNGHEHGCPIFLVPGLVPAPWEYQPLVQAANLQQPVFGLRCPDLEWARDVMSFDEMVLHYVTAIRDVRPRGPYVLVGYSWGGILAFEIANRLAADGQEVRRLVLLDTYAPRPRHRRLLRAPSGLAWPMWWGSFCAETGLAHARLLHRLGATAVKERVTLALGTGPLTVAELRRVLSAASIDAGEVDRNASHEQLCAAIVEAVKASMSDEEWQQTREFRHLPPDDPSATVKFWKVLVKNRRLANAHQPARVFPGAITIFARDEHIAVRRWQRYSKDPLQIEWVTVAGANDRDAHNAFLKPDTVAGYAARLRALIEG
jgi:thioesterase domain-containing protein/acyl carrier protein